MAKKRKDNRPTSAAYKMSGRATINRDKRKSKEDARLAFYTERKRVMAAHPGLGKGDARRVVRAMELGATEQDAVKVVDVARAKRR
jgi:hypothetical protein